MKLTEPLAIALKIYGRKIVTDWGTREWTSPTKLTKAEKAAGCTAAKGDTQLFREMMANCDVKLKKNPELKDIQETYLQAVANAKKGASR